MQWDSLQVLQQTMPVFHGLATKVSEDQFSWKQYIASAEPHKAKLPGEYDKASQFQKMLVLRVLRPEKTIQAVTDFVATSMGEQYVTPPKFDLTSAYNDSAPLTPIIFVLSSGADPTAYLISLAEDLGMMQRLKMVSLGQGQGPIAEALLNTGKDIGNWVCLQNCHLAASWMPELEKLLVRFETETINDDFRMWLTSMPSNKFPVSVLQAGIKITNEPPRGLKANLSRTYHDMTEAQYNECTKRDVWTKLLFGLAFYHAAIIERKKFGAVGWNIPYEWNNSDLQISIQMLKMYLDENEHVPYQTLNYLFASVNYGGRITDYNDQRPADSLLAKFICSEATDPKYDFAEGGIYHVLQDGDLEAYRAYIASLPLADVPEIFGLHRNAEIMFERKESNLMLDSLTTIQPRASGGAGGKTPDQIVMDMAKDISERLPALLDPEEAHLMTFQRDSEGTMNSLGTFLSIELGKFNRLLKKQKATLHEVQRAIKGLVVMSSELDAMYSAFLINRVPDLWTKVAYPSLKPLASWTVDFIERCKFMNGWLTGGPPLSYWLSGFFFPQGFMTAVLQTYARSTKTPIDSLTFRTHVLETNEDAVMEAPSTGTYIFGLYMEGARWDKKSRALAESEPAVLHSYMPVIWLEPIPLDAPKLPNMYLCPLYKTSTRAGTLSTTGHSTNFVRMFELPTAVPADHWVRRGVAMLTTLND
jgi:dynein heavy chain